MKKLFMTQVLLLLFTGVILSSCDRSVKKVAELKTGKEGSEMPALSFLSIDSSGYFQVKQQEANRPTLLFYVSPKCPYCRVQTKRIVDNAEKLKGYQIYIIGNSNFSLMQKYNRHYRLYHFSNIKVGVDTGYVVAKYFKTAGVPLLAIYDQNNTLKSTFLGTITVNQIRNTVKNFYAELK